MHGKLPLWIAVAAVVVACSLDSGQARAENRNRTSPDLFYNYYVPPVGCNSVGAAIYPSPRPTPPVVGHTYATYQPLMPHEFLYPHNRHYRRRHAEGGFTWTSVSYGREWFSMPSIPRPPKPVFSLNFIKWEPF